MRDLRSPTLTDCARHDSAQKMKFYAPVSEEHKKRQKQKARELRKSAWWKQKLSQGICYYCQGHFPKDELTMDHKVPIARGGLSSKNNIVPCCKDCNSKKQSQDPIEKILNEIKNS